MECLIGQLMKKFKILKRKDQNWTKHVINVNKNWQRNISDIPFDEILNIDKIFVPMTVPVKEDYDLVVYHCDIENNK